MPTTETKPMPRFSDKQLAELRVDFDQHKKDFDEHKIEQERRWEQLGRMVERNTEATERLAKSVEHIADSTEGVVQLYKDFKGAARVGIGLQKFLIWLAGLGTAGSVVAAALVYLLDRLGP